MLHFQLTDMLQLFVLKTVNDTQVLKWTRKSERSTALEFHLLFNIS